MATVAIELHAFNFHNIKMNNESSKSLLHILPTLDPRSGGVCQAAKSIIKGLEFTNWKHEVLCLDDPNATYLQLNDFTVHALGHGKTPWNYNKNLISWFNQNLKAFDAVIVHGLWQYQSYAVYKAWRHLAEPKPRLYVMPHGMLDPYFQKAPGRRLKAIRNILFWKFVEKRLINSSDGILFTCEMEKKLAPQSFSNYKPDHEYIVGLGVEAPPVFNDLMLSSFLALCPAVADKKYILFLSRINPKKGVDLLIEAWIKLKRTSIDLPLLIIAGPGLDTPFGQAMLSAAADHPDILFPGMLTGDAKWGAFYGTELFILPSHQENFGIAILEAMACQKPVLITDQVNIFKEISDNHSGIVFEATEQGVYQGLTDWLTLTGDAQKEYSLHAKTTYERVFSPGVAAKALLAVLDKI
jgi:glycosyltransferase involved in cell wall biosynthesis